MDKVKENILLVVVAVGIFFTLSIAAHLMLNLLSYFSFIAPPNNLSYTFIQTFQVVLIIFIVLKYIQKSDEVLKLQERLKPQCSYGNGSSQSTYPEPEEASVLVGGSSAIRPDLSDQDKIYMLSHILQNAGISDELRSSSEHKLSDLLNGIIPPKDNPQTPESTPL